MMFYIGSFVLYVLGALWVSRPLVGHMAHAIPIGTSWRLAQDITFQTADPHQLLFYCWSFARNLARGQFIFASDLEFGHLNPSHVNLMGGWGFPLQLGWLGFRALGASESLAYDLVLLGTFPLTGIATQLALRYSGASKSASLIGGIVYSFCAFRVTQAFCGHANGQIMFLFPLVWLALAGWRNTARPLKRFGFGLLLAVSLSSMGLGEWHLFYYTCLLVAGVVAVYAVQRRGAFVVDALYLVPAGVAAIAAFLFVRWAQHFGLDASASAQGRSLAQVLGNTPMPPEFFLPIARSLRDIAFGPDVERRAEYLGLSLLIPGFFAWRYRRELSFGERFDRETRWLGWTGVIALVLIFSPALPPFYWLLKTLIPYWGFTRVKGRLMYIVMFAMAGLAAWTWDRYARHGNLWLRLMPLFVIVDFIVIAPGALLSRGPKDSPVLAAARDVPGELLVLPYVLPDKSAGTGSLRMAMATEHPMLNGYEPVAPKTMHALQKELDPLNNGVIDNAIADTLRAQGVEYVLHDRDVRYFRERRQLGKEQRDALLASGFFERVTEDEDYSLLRLRSAADVAPRAP